MNAQNKHIFYLCLHTEKERIDNGYHLYQAELKKKEEKRNKKKEKVHPKNVTAELGAMFRSDSCKNESSCSADSSDEDFCIVQKRKRG